MKQFLLAVALIAVPVAAFTVFHLYQGKATVATTANLGDLTSFRTIVTDAKAIAAKGDFAAAEHRLTDFETEWDKAEPTLRPLNTDYWGNIDDAHDAALGALRKGNPVAADVSSALTALLATLDDPSRGSAHSAKPASATIGGVTIIDKRGRALPCEVMLTTFKTALASARLSEADRVTVDDFLARGIERCNADDDKRADEFFARGLSLIRR